MSKKIVEQRNYSYVFYFIFLLTLVFGLLVFTQNKMENITAKYLPKHESVRNLPSEYSNEVYSDEHNEKDPLRYLFLTFIVIISVILYVFLFITFRENSKKNRNNSEQSIILLWCAINFGIVAKLLNDYWSNDFLESKLWSNSYMFFLTIPLLVRIYFGTIQGNLIEESQLKIKKKNFANSSKLRDLKNLLDNKLVTAEQYSLKRKEILDEIIKDQIENDREFLDIKLKLKNAVDSNLIDKVDAENKIKEYREKMLVKFYLSQKGRE